jgi:hypothetical protein
VDVSISGGKLSARIRSVTKLKSMADDDDGPPQPDKESIRRDGEMVACSCSMKSIEKGGGEETKKQNKKDTK